MADEYGDDADLAAAFEAVSQFPTAPNPSIARNTTAPKIQQPTPQALPNRAAPSSILVSPRQKGNPILANIRSLPWEYGDIPSDYVLGATTCALFLSLKYHRLHPEYIYSRIRALGGKYNLRVLLTMIDIQHHEDSLKELSKTSLINNLTLILCWSAQEAGRYLELYKSYEYASPTSIRAHQATSYSEKVVEFITVPRSINKTDAVGLVSTFGSIRAAVNARPEEIAGIAGWGEKKVQRWCGTVRENFRVRKAARIGVERGQSAVEDLARQDRLFEDGEQEQNEIARNEAPLPTSKILSTPSGEISGSARMPAPTPRGPLKRAADETLRWEPGEDEEEALFLAAAAEEGLPPKPHDKISEDANQEGFSAKPAGRSEGLNEGMAAALAKLRQQ